MDMLRGYLIDPQENKHGPVEVENDLFALYDLLHCDMIEVPERKVGSYPHRFTFICDEEALLKDRYKVTATDSSYNPMLVGALLICNTDRAGCFTSLTDDEVNYIRSNVKRAIYSGGGSNPVLVGCEY